MSVAEIFSVAGKVALITGAAAGLGKAMAEAMAENGARLVLFDQDSAALGATAEAMRASGAELITCAGDVRDTALLCEQVEQAVGRWGRLDIAIANAGVSDATSKPLHEADPEDWDRVTSINLGGLHSTCRAVLPPMVNQRAGKLIIVASMWGLTAPAGLAPRPAYAASKGAAVNLTRELAVEYAPHNIQVNAICPGFFRTATRPRNSEQARTFENYTPMGRIADAAEIKGTALYLASPASDFVTGTALIVDGGVLAR